MIRFKRLVRHSVIGAASILLSTLWVSAAWGAVSAVTTPKASTGAGEQLYSQRCAGCHDGPVARAPHKIVFPMLGPEYILGAMNGGIMQAQAAGLPEEQKILLAEHLGDRALSGATQTKISYCPDTTSNSDSSETQITSWGMSLGNSRDIDANTAGLTLSEVPALKVKWAFAYPGATQARSQPIVHQGKIFVGSQDGTIYALDLASGCAHWTFKADTEVRHALSLGFVKNVSSGALFFGDFAGSVYAIDQSNGELIWKTKANDHPDTTITGSPKLYNDVLYVPLSSREWASAANPAYQCCTFRGGVVAINTADGSQKWVSYTVDTPVKSGQVNSMGVPLMAPSGAPVWNSPTIDVERNRLYVGTGENYSSPASLTSDAVLAFDLDDGQRLWSYQSLAKDAWNMACFVGGEQGNCPSENGPDLDIGASTVLHRLGSGKDIVLAGQKSGHVFGLDPEKSWYCALMGCTEGDVLWKIRIGLGGFAGGIHWGMAASGDTLYAAVADRDFGLYPVSEATPGMYSINAEDGHINWYTAVQDRCPEGSKPRCDPGLSAAITSIPGVIFAGGFDGYLMAYDKVDGKVLWEYQTNREFDTISGEVAHGGAIEGDGPVVIDGTLLVNSGYSFGSSLPGNVLLAFSVNGK